MTGAYFYLILSAASLIFLKKGFCNDIFKSSTDVIRMFHSEQQVVIVLGEFLTQTETKLEIIRRYLKDYESVLKERAKTEEEFQAKVAGNPIHAYRLMKRLYFDWQIIEKEILKDEWKNVLEPLEKIRFQTQFPKAEDFNGAVQALFRIQDTYDLNITELTRGNLRERQTRAELTAQDCFFVGKHAFHLGFYARAVEWLENSYILAGTENNKTVQQDEVMAFIQHAINVHDEVLRNNIFPIPAKLVVFPLPLKDQSAVIQREEIVRTTKYRKEEHDFKSELNSLINFNALCRGESPLGQEVLSKLKCWYEDHNQPYFRLMPIPVEQLSLDPVLLTFHNLLSDKEIEVLKELSKPLMVNSQVHGRKPLNGSLDGSGDSVSIILRSSKSASLNETHAPIISRVNKRIHLITGLATNSMKNEAVPLEVTDYGIGGHIYPHRDSIFSEYLMEDCVMDKRPCEVGERMATFMFYLSDVEQGGETVFPWAGVAVRSIKGRAIFWYNTKRNGQQNLMTLHGSCPIIFGQKWVATKWIGENAQTFNRPCALDPNE